MRVVARFLVLFVLPILLQGWVSSTAFAQEELEPQPAAGTHQPPAPRFEVWEYQVSGNTLLDRNRIEQVLTGFLGPGKTADDIELAADALEGLFRDSGYPTTYVSIPEQNVTTGVVRLDVTEGKVSRIRVTGARYFTPSSIREQLLSVSKDQALYVPGIQQDINRVNSYAPDLRVVPVLKPGAYPGEVELEIKVDDKQPLHGGVDYSNYHTASTTSTRLGANIGYYNLWQMGHSASLQVQTSPENTDEVRVFGITYLLPVSERDRLALYVMKSESEIAAVDDINVIGNGTITGLRYVLPLESSPRLVHSLSLGVDNKDFDESLELQGSDTYKTPITYNVWSILYSANFLRKKSATNLGFEYGFGITGLGNDEEEFNGGENSTDGKRFLSKPNFSHLHLKLKRVDFFGDWQLHSKMHIHFADSPLISNEQFSAGGASSVRGYYESEALGDNGFIWGVEGVTPMWLEQRDWLNNLQFTLFAEGAALEVLEPLPGQENSFELISAGIGLRMEFWKGLTVTVDSGYPFAETDEVDRGDVMTHAQMSWEF